jgi:serine/threonine protein kinase
MSIASLTPRGVLPALPLETPNQTVGALPRKGDVLDGRYLLQDAIGEGGVGTVFRALQFRVKRQVAVKFLNQDTLGEEGEHSLRPRFEHEALALAALSHPNIVRFSDYGTTQGQQYLVMELVDGRTLREVINDEAPLAPSRALALTRQLAYALSYAHEHGIVHRDLKPMNVLVQALPNQPEHLKVLDFGFAKFLPGSTLERGAPVTNAGITFGSPAYISPEQCTGSPIDGRADLYAAGVLLFEMLTGTAPYDGDTPELLRHHLLSPIPRLAARHAALAPNTELQALVDRLLAKSRDDRFADAAELIAALDNFERKAKESTTVLTQLGAASNTPSAHALAALRAGLVTLRELTRATIETYRQLVRPFLARTYAQARIRIPQLTAAAIDWARARIRKRRD